ncbi:hypothetical protein CC78DRAFT_536723 [Lojkania enalia]|uniref:Uncharacterized protein n=1 Tax=Lojkania enalia TaxID=147567 RepID=A0A9P4JZA8_9PLEO|nr:hypothetical protein CC78DRAFT_536723 [Didymosphaeria enalia]
MSSMTIAKHYTRLQTLWPKDFLRPTQPFTKLLAHRLSQSQSPNPKANIATELRNINALYTLLDNRYTRLYPLSPTVLRPTSNPGYYDALMKDIGEAPNKSWIRAKMDEWRMKIRWK